jgi:two-component system response regulator AtoC
LEFGQPFVFSSRMNEAAQEYHWPGNLRELRNFVTRTLILRDEESAYNDLRARTKTNVAVAVPAEIAPAPVEPVVEKKVPAIPGMRGVVNEIKNETEIRMLQDALSASGWNRRRAATNLNISYRTLLYKIQQHRLSA